jgi:hypothetical protein
MIECIPKLRVEASKDTILRRPIRSLTDLSFGAIGKLRLADRARTGSDINAA